jgi:hypothetical protein
VTSRLGTGLLKSFFYGVPSIFLSTKCYSRSLVSRILLLVFLLTKVESFFFFSFKNPPVERIVNSMEQKTRVFCQIDVQEFHLWSLVLPTIFPVLPFPSPCTLFDILCQFSFSPSSFVFSHFIFPLFFLLFDLENTVEEKQAN